MEYLINGYGVPIVENAEQIIDILDNDKVVYVDPESIFEPDSMENICNFIKEFI